MLSDSNYVVHTAQRLDNETTVFVGALHGMLNAEGLAHVMNDLFGNVVYAGVDTDKYKYPIGVLGYPDVFLLDFLIPHFNKNFCKRQKIGGKKIPQQIIL